MADTDSENLSKEEREARDKADREREAAEQAGDYLFSLSILHEINSESALPYSWTQELGEVDVLIAVPKGTRARDLAVVIAKKKLSVGFNRQEPIMTGELCKEIKVEDSTWTLRMGNFWFIFTFFRLTRHAEDGQEVHIHLEKLNKQAWWDNVLTHHPKIDTKKIEPPTGKLSDLEGETR